MKKWASLLLILTLLLSGCTNSDPIDSTAGSTNGKNQVENVEIPTADAADLGDDSHSFGDSLEDLNAYAGYFEDESVDVTVTCESGTAGCYTLEGNTLTFTAVKEDSVYSVSGNLKGNIIIDIGDDYKFDLELKGLNLVCDTVNPITVLSGDEVSITAKNEYENYIYDTREAVDETDETAYSGAIHSVVDLEICGKGSLTLISEQNNGIHSKDDLQVKNLTLLVACMDNALKGNDSVSLENCTTTLIASAGDGIKTTNTDISEKGNQRGTVTVSGGTHSIYAACDGIDAAYDAVIQDDTTVLNIYTDKYSNYSTEVTAVSEDCYYIRFTTDAYQYSVKYYNSDDDYCWVTAAHHSTVSGGMYNYYYYSYPIMTDQYEKVQFFIYSSDMQTEQEEEYLVKSDYLTPNTGYDTFALSSRGNSLNYSWTNYTTTVQEGGFGGHGGGMGGMGGMGGGNSDKSSYSTKGIKAGNAISILSGTIAIKAYDDAIHGGSDTALENGETPTGNVTVSGGSITVYSNDDGIHADGIAAITGGAVTVTDSYEGIEGTQVEISGGNISVNASDDGINSTATSGTGVQISGGRLYVYCSGDGIDANSRSSYTGIVFAGGESVIISTSSGNSAIDTEQGYAYEAGRVVAIMPSGGMTNEATHCSNFRSVATTGSVYANSGSFMTVLESGSTVVTVQVPSGVSGVVIYLGSSSANIDTANSADVSLDPNGVCWGDSI